MQQLEMFAEESVDELGCATGSAHAVALVVVTGLSYVRDYVGSCDEAALLCAIDDAPWSTELERRVQHYGYKYDYRNRRIDDTMRVGPMPNGIQEIAERLRQEGYFDRTPDQCIVNEYLPGQGIAPHIDCEPCFGGTIASLSLGSHVVMDFTRAGTRHAVCLEPRSLVVLQGEARYEWKHGIAKRKNDVVGGIVIPRSRRVSLTFRSVVT